MIQLMNKRVILGVTGGIAAYKSAEIVRRLREEGAEVCVIMTNAAQEFITPLTFQALSGRPVRTDLLDANAEAAMGHIELARWADVVLVAPASAEFMANLACGHANDLLTTVCLATSAKIAIAPAMNQQMWLDPATQQNLATIEDRCINVFGPGSGSQACGDYGPGRMLEPVAIVEHLANSFESNILSGVHILITAGPTHEAIDPVRYFTNYSSGKMGYAIAEAAVDCGAKVTLVSGPTELPAPDRVTFKSVTTAQEMYECVIAEATNIDMFISNAAVADYRCEKMSPVKMPKEEEELTLTLVRNQDIVASVGGMQNKPFIVGFAAETDGILEKAHRKMQKKGMDIIAANQVGLADRGFG